VGGRVLKLYAALR